MPRRNTAVAVVRNRMLADAAAATYGINEARSRSRSNSTSSNKSSGSDRPAAVQPITDPPKRISPIPPPMMARRRKRDFTRELSRTIRSVSDAGGVVKLALFLVLALAVWMLLAWTAPHPHQHQHQANTKTRTASHSATRAGMDLSSSSSSTSAASSLPSPPPRVAAVPRARFPHDSQAFTQGLLIDDGIMWESTGLYGRSTLRQVDLSSGTVLQSYSLPSSDFGEGLCLVEDRLIQLTWQNHVAYIYDKKNFTSGPYTNFTYATDGWGVTHDTQHYILSDGSDTLLFLDPTVRSWQESGTQAKNFRVQRKLQVRAWQNGAYRPVRMLNELEYIDGHIYANVWYTPFIAIIEPTSGLVRKWIDIGSLHPVPSNPEATPNGVAYDARAHKLYVTGKLWPLLYEIDYISPY